MTEELFPEEIENPIVVAEEDEDLEFVADLQNQVAEYMNFDPSQIVTLRSSRGGTFPIPVTEPTSIRELIRRASLTVGTDIEYWVEQTQVPDTTEVVGGTIVTLVGNVKGGAR